MLIFSVICLELLIKWLLIKNTGISFTLTLLVVYFFFLEGHSSDYDEDSFLPRTGAPPSLSQYDSLMEPLDDEFHAGLDFQNVTARSVSDFGVPDNLLTRNGDKRQQSNRETLADDTDEDIDDLPVEETDGTTRYGRSTNMGTSVEGNGFEFVNKADLHDVTDEEINDQNVGRRNKGLVSNMLGY